MRRVVRCAALQSGFRGRQARVRNLAARAAGAAIADKAAVGLLLVALSTLWLFERNFSLASLEEGGLRAMVATQTLTPAANLGPEHRFFLFAYQTGETAEDRSYVPYNRFPIGTYLVVKGALLPFGHSLAAQIRAVQNVALLFFAGTVVLAYRVLRRLQGDPWIALTATLLAFSSFYVLYYADMISTEIAGFFGVWLTAYGLIRFERDGRLRPLLVKAGIALGFDWHVMSLLLPFVVLGLAQEVRRAYAAGALRRVWLGSPYLKLGLAATLACAALLAFGVAREYFALGGTRPWAQLPTVQAFSARSALQSAQWPWWEQWRRIGILTAPYALVRGLGYEYDAARPFFIALGLVVGSLGLWGLRGARPRQAQAAVLLSGWIWMLAVPGAVHMHDFEAWIHVGLPLLVYAQMLQTLQRRVPWAAFMPGAAVAALAVFGLSALLISRRLPAPAYFPSSRATLADFTTIRQRTAGRSVCIPAPLKRWVGGSLHERVNPLTYYLAGSRINYDPAHCEASASDYMIAPVRVKGDALLTPDNRVLFLYAVGALEETPYRAALRALRSAAPLARAEFDVYAYDQALIYHRPTPCRPADAQTRVILHAEPVNAHDLPAPRRPHGFDNLNFNFAPYGVQLDRQCLAIVPLPAYPIARIRTGTARWQADFPFRPTYEAAYRAIRTATPLVRAEFNVYARERTLIYHKTACRAAEAAHARFFLHAVPVRVQDLPAPRRAHGFDNLDFDFARRGAQLDRQCLALAPLPAYPIARIRTGQFSRADGPLWAVELPWAPRPRADPP